MAEWMSLKKAEYNYVQKEESEKRKKIVHYW